MLKPLLICTLLFTNLSAAERPAPVLLWPDGAPGSEDKTEEELVTPGASGEESITRVHKPSILPYLPAKERASGTAVLVIPGGGHRNLAITHEGYNVANWLRDHGIAAFVLKYRLARETNSTYKLDVHPLADTQRALRLIRSRAEEWNLNPNRLGAMGFSAGGELVAMASMKFDEGNANSNDPIEKQKCRPDFQALIYPGTSWIIQPTKDSPPAFLACAYNDRKDISEGLAEAYLRFKKAGAPPSCTSIPAEGMGLGFATRTKSRLAPG